MPNPPMIHTQSSKLQHYLGLVDTYLVVGKPRQYEIEPRIDDEYQPDAIAIIDNQKVVIEYQRSYISDKKMQGKIDLFAKHYRKHGSTILWLFSDKPYNITVPNGFTVEQKKITSL